MQRNKVIGLVAAAIGAGINASGVLEDKGEGDKFTINGVVEAVGEHSLELSVDEVEVAEGDAKDWFQEESEHRVHDNYRTCGFTSRFTGKPKMHQTSQYLKDIDGKSITLKAVRVGSEVEISGHIIRSFKQCKTSKHTRNKHAKRPTFESLEVIG